MPMIAIASDKGAPGVTTAALALAAVWPRPVLLAECDPAGGDVAYRFPAVGGGPLDPRRGVLSLAVAARRGIQPEQVWQHVQKMHGNLDLLAGVTNAEQGAGLNVLWGPIGKALAGLARADVIADCGRLGADGPIYDLLAEATTVVLVTRPKVGDVIRTRDRAAAFAAAAESRGRRGFAASVLVVAPARDVSAAAAEVHHVLGQAKVPATVIGGLADDAKGAALLGGDQSGRLSRTMLIRTAREIAQRLALALPPIGPPVGPPMAPAMGPPVGPPMAPPFGQPIGQPMAPPVASAMGPPIGRQGRPGRHQAPSSAPEAGPFLPPASQVLPSDQDGPASYAQPTAGG